MPRATSSFTKDRSVVDHQFAPGTIRRIVGFARPYRRQIAMFSPRIGDALIGAATPLLYKAIIDDGIAGARSGLVVTLAIAVGALAVVSGAVGVIQRWYSASARD
ncbi:MAG: hypothetical protein R2705_13400 [Ilumatobacteraceae bacterium]